MSMKEELKHLFTPEEPIVPKPPEPFKRTLGSIQLALQAQKIYDPSIPSVPKPMTPTKPEEHGTAAKLGTEGRWGKPE